MLPIEGKLEAAVRRAAARVDVAPEALVEQLLELGLAQLELALGQSALEPDDDDAWRPPLGVLTARARPEIEIIGRGYVPEPKAPRLFCARRQDGVAGREPDRPRPDPRSSSRTARAAPRSTSSCRCTGS